MLIRRNLAGTTIALEKPFWDCISQRALQAGASWKTLTLQLLEGKPSTVSRASWIRTSLL